LFNARDIHAVCACGKFGYDRIVPDIPPGGGVEGLSAGDTDLLACSWIAARIFLVRKAAPECGRN
jgi:hypothetical protein